VSMMQEPDTTALEMQQRQRPGSQLESQEDEEDEELAEALAAKQGC